MKYCEYCGNKVDTTENYCNNCGGKLKETVQNDYSYEQMKQSHKLEPGQVLVNKWIYCALAFFLGIFGVHKFYAQKTGQGILFFIFSFTTIPALLGIIDAVITLATPAGEDSMIAK